MYHVLPHVGLPISSPLRTSSAAMRNGTDERRWLPCWNTMPVFRHVSRMISPSRGQNAHGFSTYTAFPARIAITALHAWKWSGVSERMPSTLGSSRILRRSFSFFGRLAPLLFFSTRSAA